MGVKATIVIPTFNRLEALLVTIGALEGLQAAPGSWEVVIVDDGSTDATAEAVPERARERGLPIRYLRQANRGPAAARNRGAREAGGEVLIFIDDDIVVPPDFLSSHLEALSSHPGCWVIGRIVHPPELRLTPFGRYRDAAWEAFHRSQPPGVSDTLGMTAANLSLPRADFERLGGFDEGFTVASGEDWDLSMRARHLGIRVLYEPGVVVVHNDWAVDLDRFCERQRLYSLSDVRLWRKHGETCPRARLVRENGPVDWRRDSPGIIAKKAVKRVLTTGLGRKVVGRLCEVAERWAPDTRLCLRAYDTAVALAIFRGVREGLERYPVGQPAA